MTEFAEVALKEINVESETLLSASKSFSFQNGKEYDVPFTYSGGATAGNYNATLRVTQTGKLSKGGKATGTVIVTLHDLGLNHFTNYATLFNCEEMEPVQKHFTVYHVDFPCMSNAKMQNSVNPDGNGSSSDNTPSGSTDGPLSGTGGWDKNLVYPSMEELAKAAVPAVLEYFSLASVILISTGAGSNVALRYGLAQPSKLMGVCFINPIFNQITWAEWFGLKLSLGGAISSDKIEENILNYLFNVGELSDPSYDVVQGLKESLRQMDKDALAGFEASFKNRSLITMERPIPGVDDHKNKDTFLKVPATIIIGDHATTFYEHAMELNQYLNPKDSNFCKLADAGAMVYEEQPGKVGEALRLFLQGIGYMASVPSTRLTKSRSNSVVSAKSIEEYNSTAANVLAKAATKLTNGTADHGASGDFSETPSKEAAIGVSDKIGLVEG